MNRCEIDRVVAVAFDRIVELEREVAALKSRIAAIENRDVDPDYKDFLRMVENFGPIEAPNT